MTEDEDREMDTDALIGELIAQESNRLMEQAGSLSCNGQSSNRGIGQQHRHGEKP